MQKYEKNVSLPIVEGAGRSGGCQAAAISAKRCYCGRRGEITTAPHGRAVGRVNDEAEMII